MADGTMRLCIFTRAPIRGAVKTRLASGLGEEAALAAHETLVQACLERVLPCDAYRAELWIDTLPNDPRDPARRAVGAWASAHALGVLVQEGADLGARMRQALRSGLEPGQRAVLIGTDCPDIDARYVAAAFAGLAHADIVLGPTEDGGYGLIGVTADHPELFRSIRWSTSAVLGETLARAAGLGLSVELLPMIWDVDTALDWRRYERLRAAGESDR